jgi:hypothetical protein
MVCLLGLATCLAGTPPSWGWVQRNWGTGECRTTSTLEDSQGRILACGYFTETVEFGEYVLVSSGGSDGFLAQMDADGNWLWAVGFGGMGTDTANRMALGNQDQIMLGGSFDQSFSLGQAVLTNNGGRDFFLAEFNSEGALLWAESYGSATNDDLHSLSVASTGEIYLCGSFRYNLSIGSIQFTATNYGVFIAKMGADMSALWGQSTDDIFGEMQFANFGVDVMGNCYLVGNFRDYFSIGSPNTIQLSGQGACGFVIKLDPNGNGIWGERIGSGYCAITSSYVDPMGNTYISAEPIFEPMNEADGKHLDNAPHCAKLGPNGLWLWVDVTSNLGSCSTVRVSGDSSGNCYISGRLWRDCSFGEYNLTASLSNHNLYVAKGDTWGNWLWGIQTFDSGYLFFANVTGIIASQGDRCVISGFNYSETLQFGDFTLEPSQHVYSWFIRTNGASVYNHDEHLNQAPQALTVFPNPSNSLVNFRLDKGLEPGSTAELYNIRGQMVMHFSPERTGATELSWDGKDNKGAACVPGLYFLKIKCGKETIVKAFTRI